MGKTLLLTGGAGFIGSNLVREFLNETDDTIVNVDKLTYAGHRESLSDVENHPRYRFVEGDISDAQLLNRVFQEFKPAGVLNLAAESHVDRSIDDSAAFIQTNVIGTFQLLEASRKFKNDDFRFLHVSTDEVFGSLKNDGKFSEQTPYDPSSPYSASKASSDHLVRAWRRTYNLPTLITNCSNNYGPYQFPEKLIPVMILNATEGKPLPVYGEGKNVRDWLFVQDHARAIRMVFEKGKTGEDYLIGGNCEMTNIEVVRLICRTLDKIRPKSEKSYEDQIEFVTDRPGHDFRYAIDFSKIQNELDWSPSVSFQEGIELTIKWYLENQSWCEKVSGNSRERLGLGKK